MRILSVRFIKPFLSKPGGLFYYDFSEWMDLPSEDSYRSLREGHLDDQFPIVFGYVESTSFTTVSINTIIFTDKFCVVPYAHIDNPEKLAR